MITSWVLHLTALPFLAQGVKKYSHQGRTDHFETRALPRGPGSVGGPMRCPWYLFHRL
ncbi:unnamed protein product [Staurois parvus]|uniref:Uncharacterized protein n=1 Tax=Staurois parvus TaxID=386267 RepID=A0ABN9G8I4_9NEOB|nr:unnamed protein product [Staurois parvus]